GADDRAVAVPPPGAVALLDDVRTALSEPRGHPVLPHVLGQIPDVEVVVAGVETPRGRAHGGDSRPRAGSLSSGRRPAFFSAPRPAEPPPLACQWTRRTSKTSVPTGMPGGAHWCPAESPASREAAASPTAGRGCSVACGGSVLPAVRTSGSSGRTMPL